MKRVCYWCAKDMGKKGGSDEEGVFHSLCDECADRLKLEERLPELLRAVADLRKQNSSKVQNQKPSFFNIT